MRKYWLFPRYFKWLGLLFFLSAFFFSPMEELDDVHQPMGLLIQISSFTGLLFIAGASLKVEDEWTQLIRLNCIKIALLLYMLIRISLKAIAFYQKDPDWLPVNFQINMLLILFILIFYFKMKLIPFFRETILKSTKN